MANNKQSSRLYIGSLGTSATQQDIENLFGKFGKLTEVRMNRNFAFVQYTDEDSAAEALQALNGTAQFGRNIDVQFARAPRTAGNFPDDNKNDDKKRDRSPINRDRGGLGGGGRGGPGGPPGGRGGPGLGGPGREPFGRDRSPFGGGNRGGPFSDRDSGGPFGGRDNRDPPGGRGGGDFGDRPGDRFSGGGRDFDRGGLGGGLGGGRDFGGRDRDPWAAGGAGGRGGPEWDRGAPERDRVDPWNNGPAGRGPPPREEFRDGADFRGGPGDLRDRDFGPRGGLDRDLGRNDFRDRAPDFGRDRPGGFGREEDRFGGRPGFRDEPAFRDDFRRDADGRGPSWEKPANSDPVPLNTPHADRTNDIEIICLSKSITDYGEYIETRLKSIGFSVDIMFPNESAPIPRVLGNIASRGTLYAIIVNPAHKLNRSLTLQVLHGTPQEHRNMLIEDAIIFLNRNFENYSRIQTEKRGPKAPPEQVRHLLELVITASRQLTPTQFDILIQYFVNEKLKVEPTNPPEPLQVTPQAELQTRILSILNRNSGQAASSPLMSLGGNQPASNDSPLLKNPSVQKALDSLISGGSNILSALGNQNRF